MTGSNADQSGPPVETLLLLTLNQPIIGTVVDLEGCRYRIVGGTWTGTLARLRVQRLEDESEKWEGDPLWCRCDYERRVVAECPVHGWPEGSRVT